MMFYLALYLSLMCLEKIGQFLHLQSRERVCYVFFTVASKINQIFSVFELII